MFQYQAEFDLAVECAKEAGVLIQAGFERKKTLTFKGEVDVDHACEKLVMEKISLKFPSHLFVAEETVSAGNGEEVLTDAPTWLIDPIDGTTNFVHGLPFSCISIGFAVNHEVVVGVVYSPMLDLLFTARKGFGAQRNGEPISISQSTDLKQCLIATGFPYERDDGTLDFLLSHIKETLKACRCVRRCGSAALGKKSFQANFQDMCFVAQGTYDIYYEKGIHAWDVAAGCLMVQEAGGIFTSPWRSDFDICNREIMVGSKVVVDKLKALWQSKLPTTYTPTSN